MRQQLTQPTEQPIRAETTYLAPSHSAHSFDSFDHICLSYSPESLVRQIQIRLVTFRRTAGRGFSCCRYQEKVPDTWPLRGLPLIEKILPKAALWMSAFGAPKLTVFNALKNSP